MEIKLCQNKEEWNKGLEKGLRLASTSLGMNRSDQAHFLQSWEWGEFQENMGRKAVRLDVDGELLQGFVHSLSFLGKYVYFPRVNFANRTVVNDKMINDICEELIKYGKKEDFLFIRIEPLQNLSPITYHLSPIKNRQPKQTLILDLTKPEEQILAAMHPKTRYNIHVAERHRVEVREEKNIETFWQLNLETINRDKFRSHEKKYYEKMLELPLCHQLTAYYQGKAIASNILVAYGDTVTYLHGASANEFRNVMAPHLLQWEGIKLGKRLGYQYYDFWGVAPQGGAENHRWAGVMRFKTGFGGEYREYLQACDIILKPWKYRLYKFARKLLTFKF